MAETNEIVKKSPEEHEPTGDDNFKQPFDTMKLYKDDISMLEDEEMPTYTSISSSGKANNSTSINEQKVDDVPDKVECCLSPELNQDQEDNASIYVVSDSDLNDDNHDDDDFGEEEEEEYNSEDMNEDEEDEDEEDEDYQNDFPRIHRGIYKNSYDDRDQSDRSDRSERDSDEFEADRFERASDDFILRTSSGSSKKKDFIKERSRSLQDLSILEARYDVIQDLSWERNNHGYKKNPFSHQDSNPKAYYKARYEHVESKVKHYIQQIKEQNKASGYDEFIKNKPAEHERAQGPNESEEIRKSSTGAKNIKEYAAKVIKEFEREEYDRKSDPLLIFPISSLENGQGVNHKLSSDLRETNTKIPMEIDSISDEQNHNFKKSNGFIDFAGQSEVTFTPIIKETTACKVIEGKCTPVMKESTTCKMIERVNGVNHKQLSEVDNPRTLTYEEYMRGSSNTEKLDGTPKEVCLLSSEKVTLNPSSTHIMEVETDSIKLIENDSVKLVTDMNNCVTNNTESTQKIDNSDKIINQATETVREDNSEIVLLRTTLNHRNAQFDCLQVAYQKTLADNFAMKQEIENLRKALKDNEDERNRERKSIGVQTDGRSQNDYKKEALSIDENKMSSSSITSAVSSIHCWSESAGSPGISLQIPDLRNALNSDDSVLNNTPKKTTRASSRAFATSSRILRTLSNITAGKTISNRRSSNFKNQELQDNECDTEIPSTSGISLNSKKRKAEEMIEVCTSEQPFKIPHTSVNLRKETNQLSNSETSQSNGSLSVNEKEADETIREEKEGNIREEEDIGDGLKYFVYQDDENNKNRSFLIQVEEPDKVTNKGAVRECGPYLLGNLEVRMTEVNGTINIWGKEISLDCTEEETDKFGRSSELKSDLYWKKSPQTESMNKSHLLSSFNKKLRTQSHVNDHSKFSPQEQFYCRRNPVSTNYCRGYCHSSGCPRVMEMINHERCYSNYCMERCGCDSVHCGIQEYSGDNRRHSYSGGFNGDSAGHSHHTMHCLSDESEASFRHQISNWRSCQLNDEKCQNYSKSCNLSRKLLHPCHSKCETMRIGNRNYCSNNSYCRNRSPSAQDEDDPLVSQHTTEPPEVQKRKHSGKRVRGLLMDLLRGCGDCRTPNTTNMSRINDLRNSAESSYMANVSPEIVVTPYSPGGGHLTDKNRQHQSVKKCCESCSRRNAINTEIEEQLELFRIELERLRSHSYALVNMLKSTE